MKYIYVISIDIRHAALIEGAKEYTFFVEGVDPPEAYNKFIDSDKVEKICKKLVEKYKLASDPEVTFVSMTQGDESRILI